jgi:LPS export ABC transporter protein LptC
MVSPVYIKPVLALLVIVAVTAIAAVVYRGGSNGSPSVTSANQTLPQNIDVALKKARFSEICDGIVVWELTAEKVDYDKKGNTAFLTGIIMNFQRSKSHGAITVTADSGTYFTTEKNVRLKGNIHVSTEDGAAFETTSLVYTGAKAQFSTNDTVTFRQHKLNLKAVGMILGLEDQRARFHSSIDAAIIKN